MSNSRPENPSMLDQKNPSSSVKQRRAATTTSFSAKTQKNTPSQDNTSNYNPAQTISPIGAYNTSATLEHMPQDIVKSEA